MNEQIWEIYPKACNIVDTYRRQFANMGLEDAMCMKNARVAVFEDNRDYSATLIDWLSSGGHFVVGTASNMEEARALINNLGSLDVQVVTVDGNLGDITDNRDGQHIISTIRHKYPHIIIIGLGGDSLPQSDHDLTKDYGARNTVDFITNL